MPQRLCIIDIPGLSRPLLDHVPPQSALARWLAGKTPRPLIPSFPAVTCSVQATLTTGQSPARHGIIANGLPTFRFPDDQALVDASNFAEARRQISFWEQSNQFLNVPRFWKNKYKTALLFFQHSMPGFAGTPQPAADIVLTPKPDHGPDGKLVSLCWSNPPDLVPRLFKELGPFPLMNYWGPMASIPSSRWIAKAAAIVWREQCPELQWTYIPHLDYDLQRFGPNSPQARQAVVDLADALDPLLSALVDSRIVLLSEYAITEVRRAIQPNILLRDAGFLRTQNKRIDYKNSTAFAMVDHQIAHIYTRTDAEEVHRVLDTNGIQFTHLDHPRAGERVLIAPPDAWFDYRWWTDPADAPDFAGAVDIHQKPGYDPLELFWNPQTKTVSQTPSQIHGSHGRTDTEPALFIADGNFPPTLSAIDIASILESLLHNP